MEGNKAAAFTRNGERGTLNWQDSKEKPFAGSLNNHLEGMGRNMDRNKESYLEGEYNATVAVGKAITEANEACCKKITDPAMKAFVSTEFLGIIFRATQLIKERNDFLGIKTPTFRPGEI